MPTEISTARAQKLHADGALFVETLPAESYERQHIPGAVNVPLAELTADRVSSFDRGAPVVVYCYDYQCDLSARGAARFELLGFEDVYDYAPSKQAWLAGGLPFEGTDPPDAQVAARADRAVPTCTPEDTVGAVADRIGEWPVCVVVNADRIVLGAVRSAALSLDAGTAVTDVLDPAPNTVRPDRLSRDVLRDMQQEGHSHVLVTTYAGALVGLFRPENIRAGG